MVPVDLFCAETAASNTQNGASSVSRTSNDDEPYTDLGQQRLQKVPPSFCCPALHCSSCTGSQIEGALQQCCFSCCLDVPLLCCCGVASGLLQCCFS